MKANNAILAKKNRLNLNFFIGNTKTTAQSNIGAPREKIHKSSVCFLQTACYGNYYGLSVYVYVISPAI
jgi:hypothetical protein